MDIKKLDWIISIVKEQMVAAGPTNSAGTGGFTASANSKGPVAGFDPVIGMARRKKIIGLGKNSRNRWKKPTP